MLLTVSFACEGIASIAEKTVLSQKGGYVIFFSNSTMVATVHVPQCPHE